MKLIRPQKSIMPKEVAAIKLPKFTIALVIVFAAIITSASAQETVVPATVDNTPTMTAASAGELLKRVEETTDLDEETKKKATELLRQAVDQAKRSDGFATQRENFEATVNTINDRAEAFKKRARDIKEAKPPSIESNASLSELEQQLSRTEQQAKDLREKVAVADSDIVARAARIKTIRERLVEAKRQLEEAAKQGVVVASDTDMLDAAKKAELQTRTQLLRAEIPALEAELTLLDAENVADIPRLRRDDAASELAATENLLQILQTAVRAGRASAASKQLETTQSEAEKETDPLLRALAERNVELALRYKSLNELIAATEMELKGARSIRDDWKKEADSTKNQVETIGLTSTTGAMLRQQKLKLPNPKVFRARVADRNPVVNDAQLTWLKLEGERSNALDETIRQNDKLSDPTSSTVREEAEALIEKRNELLAPLIRAQNDYFQKLVELSNTQQQIAIQIEGYEAFIDERVLWVRSSAPMSSLLFNQREARTFDKDESFIFDKNDLKLLDRTRWRDMGQRALADVFDNVAWYLVAAFGLVFLIRDRLLFRSRILEYGTAAESGSCTLFSPTLRTLFLTVAAAAPWPAVLTFLSWRFSLSGGTNEVSRALAQGFYTLAVAYFPLEFIRLVCRSHGLAEAHFGWNSKSVQLVRAHIRSVMLISMPLVLITAMLSSSPSSLGEDVLERLTFIAVTISLSYFLSRVLHPRTGAFSGYLIRNAGGWVNRLQPIWYWSIILSPLLLTGLTFFGYYYTAQQLSWRLYATACLLGSLMILTAIISRLLLIQRRRLSIEQARQRRAAQLLASQEESTSTGTVEELPTAEDLRAQIIQSQSLLRTVMVGVALAGVWIAWVDVLPAFGFLEQWPLWESTVQKSELSINEDGEDSYVTREIRDPVTIAEVVLSLVIFGLTLVSSRNIPGVLEISILQRLPIEASVRYAITTIVSYLIVLVGLIVACSTIGIHWKQVQWMATALTFGLAFGLQEMFANFVAGIIILFERPIRVGDIVTIDDVSGTVSRVKIRATTITNWDRKDYIVPNKDFITGRVLNWTLSDQFNRIVINVGVAYQSDTKKTIEKMQQVADEHPLIVRDPAPNVTFEEFGASSLNFVLRCYIAMKDMSSRLQIVHQLHMGIDEAFRKANIEIAFPQQDIHIRSTPNNVQQQIDALPINGSGKKEENVSSYQSNDGENKQTNYP